MSDKENRRESSADNFEPAANAPETRATLECPECHGKGTFALLITVRTCQPCGGTGRIEPAAPAPEQAPRDFTYGYVYDPTAGFEIDEEEGHVVREEYDPAGGTDAGEAEEVTMYEYDRDGALIGKTRLTASSRHPEAL